MLVKKFEAPTMKEALDLIKNQLGPDAIILSARENNSTFGLAGRSSVEVTAAVSEIQVKKRQLAEARIKESEREKLRKSSARTQKEFIQKSVNRFARQQQSPSHVESSPVRRYIDIADEENLMSKTSAASRPAPIAARTAPATSTTATHVTYNRVAAKATLPQQTFEETPTWSNQEVLSLKSEVQHLRSLLESFKKTPQGVVSLHPGAESGLPYEMTHLFQKLTESGISDANATELCQEGLRQLSHEQLKKKPFVDAWAAKKILSDINLSSDPHVGGLHLFVGSSGQGKTSALVKIASHFVIHARKPVAILTTDTKRVGAAEQLKIYSQILNVPFAVMGGRADWPKCESLLKNYHAVLVDFPGLSLKNLEEVNELQALLPPQGTRAHTHLVLSVNQKDVDAFEIARRYKLTRFDDVIFSKLDESVNHGIIYNFQKEFKIPLHSFGVGPLIPEDYEPATKERIVDLIFKLSKLKG